MNKNDLIMVKCQELDSNELAETTGGIVIPLALALIGGYYLQQIAGNPQASYDAFMRGWNSL